MESCFTLLCVREDGAIPFVDLQTAEAAERLEPHARRLLKEHGSAEVVEIWSSGALVMTVPRMTP